MIFDILYLNIVLVLYFVMCGDVFKSFMKIDLIEDEIEYKISCVKYIFDSYIVFEFICSNIIKE